MASTILGWPGGNRLAMARESTSFEWLTHGAEVRYKQRHQTHPGRRECSCAVVQGPDGRGITAKTVVLAAAAPR